MHTYIHTYQMKISNDKQSDAYLSMSATVTKNGSDLTARIEKYARGDSMIRSDNSDGQTVTLLSPRRGLSLNIVSRYEGLQISTYCLLGKVDWISLLLQSSAADYDRMN